MPRFFFHVFDDIVASDDEGRNLPDLEAAKREAMRGARALACEQVASGHLSLHHHIDVADEAGAVVYSLSFGEAVAVEP